MSVEERVVRLESHIDFVMSKLKEATNDIRSLDDQFQKCRYDQSWKFRTELYSFRTEVANFRTEVVKELGFIRVEMAKIPKG
jgi:hypothetical protein